MRFAARNPATVVTMGRRYGNRRSTWGAVGEHQEDETSSRAWAFQPFSFVYPSSPKTRNDRRPARVHGTLSIGILSDFRYQHQNDY